MSRFFIIGVLLLMFMVILTGCDQTKTNRQVNEVLESNSTVVLDQNGNKVYELHGDNEQQEENSIPLEQVNQSQEGSEKTENEGEEIINDKKEMSIVTMKTNMGDMKIKLYNDVAPKTVQNFLDLAEKGFYNQIKFHRIIKDFMIQGGDPLTKDNSKIMMWGTGGPGYKFEDEINDRKLVKGSLAMANSGPDTNGSQFFIVTAEATPWLDGAHTNFGEIVEGMGVLENIGNVETGGRDIPVDPIEIISIIIE